MTEFKKEEVRLSRRQAAERLVDLAYSLTTGRALEVDVEGEMVRVPIPDQVVLERESRSQGDCVELRWSFASETTREA